MHRARASQDSFVLFDFSSFDRLYANIPTCHDTTHLLKLDLVADYAIDFELDRVRDAVVVEMSHVNSLSMIEIGIRESKWIDTVLNASWMHMDDSMLRFVVLAWSYSNLNWLTADNLDLF